MLYLNVQYYRELSSKLFIDIDSLETYIKENYDTVAVLRNLHVCTCVHCVKRKKTKVTS